MTHFGHLADTHLGHRQYGLRQREDDMVSTTRATLNELLHQGVDAVLLPGDLFHSRDLRPKVLDDAEQALELVPAEVPVLVSRGNHDENLTPRNVTWLNYLHRRGHIVLLEADLETDPECAQFSPYDPSVPGDCAGFYDIDTDLADGPVRVFGLQWRGARTDRALEQIAHGIRETNAEYGAPAYTVLLAHFGIEDEVPSFGGTITHAELAPVKDVVDYLALGHVHKRYEAADWIYNPGSPEAHDTLEGRHDWDHGCFSVELSRPSDPPAHSRPGDLAHEVTHTASKRRPYYQIEFTVTPYESPSQLESAFRERVREEKDAIEEYCDNPKFKAGEDRRPPIIDLRFTGTLQFDRADLRTDTLATWAEDDCTALYVQVTSSVRTADVQKLLAELDGDSVFVDGRLNTDALERRVFETIATESEYSEHADEVADVLERAHHMAQTGESVDDIVDVVRENRRSLFPDVTADVHIEVSEDPFADNESEDPAIEDQPEQEVNSDGGTSE